MDDEPLLGEDEFYDLWLGAQKQAIDLADRLNLTDEDLRRIGERWRLLGGQDGHAMAALASHVTTIRLLKEATNLMRPDEKTVLLSELADRLKQGRGEA